MTLSRVSLGVQRSKPKRLFEQMWEAIRAAVLISTQIGVLLTAASIRAQVSVEQIVAQKVQPILPKNASGGGVAVRMSGKTSFFNYGMADNAQNRQVTADSIFNIGSVGKVFATTLLAQAVKQGELSLDDPVAKYVTELQRGGDIRRITLGQLASHSSGLPRVPQQYETWHRGRYTWPDFVRFLNSWKAATNHEPGQQYLYSNAAMVLLRVALERRFNTRFAALMHQRLAGPLGMTSTALPLPRDLLGRAVQGYGPMGKAIGRPGEEGGTFQWPGSGQSIRRHMTWPPSWLPISASFPAMGRLRTPWPLPVRVFLRSARA
jgi:beta-lactamase class C